MFDVSLHQLLVLYTWFPLAALLFLVLLIARFYQKFSDERTFYWFYAVGIVIFGIFFVRSASLEVGMMDVIVTILSIVGGGLLIFLSLVLYRRMIHNDR